MKNIIFASNNKHKIKEVKEILAGFNVISLNDIGFAADIEETGVTFLENALIKAQAIYNFLKEKGINCEIISDDSGLCVDALNGEPGVYSARYGGNHDAAASRAKLLKELTGVKNRKAHFECVIVKMEPNGSYTYSVGKTHGHILIEETGDNSFGYDCLFYSNDLEKSFGQASAEEKNLVSHRGRALKEMFKL